MIMYRVEKCRVDLLNRIKLGIISNYDIGTKLQTYDYYWVLI